jgi:hypothetical protein
MRPGGASLSPVPSGSSPSAPGQTRRDPGRGGRGSQPCRCRRSCSLPVSIPWQRRQSGSRLAWSRKLPPSTSATLWWTSVAGRPQRQRGWRQSARRRARLHAPELHGSRLRRVTLEAYEHAFRVMRIATAQGGGCGPSALTCRPCCVTQRTPVKVLSWPATRPPGLSRCAGRRRRCANRVRGSGITTSGAHALGLCRPFRRARRAPPCRRRRG